MPSTALECPHCGAEKIGFNLVAQYSASIKPSSVPHRFITLAICTKCESAVVIEYVNPRGAKKNSPLECPADPESFDWVPWTSYPKPESAKPPSHASPELSRYFEQAAKALKRDDNDASGAMSRKVVDVSTQQLLGQDSKKFSSIRDRIDELANRGRITQDLKVWAHEIRLGGNTASHDEEPYTPTEAEELLDFAELYLTYVYTLPGRLAERKKRGEEKKAEELTKKEG